MFRLQVLAWSRVLASHVRMHRRAAEVLLAAKSVEQPGWGSRIAMAAALAMAGAPVIAGTLDISGATLAGHAPAVATTSPANQAATARFVAQFDASSPDNYDAIQRAAREGIRVLSPTQSLPVTPVANVPFQELPLDPSPCQMQPVEGLKDASLHENPPAAASQTTPDASSSDPAPGNSGDASAATAAPADQPAALPVECANLFPDIAPTPQQEYSFGLETVDPSLQDPVVVVTTGHPSTRPWFSAVGSQQGFSYGGGNWTYRDTVGPTVSMGNLTANAPIWGSAVPIGGLQVSSSWTGGATLSEGAFAYSSAVGRLNYTDTTVSAGAIDYGVTAGSGSLRYGLTPRLTLESQMQSAPDMSTHGLGTTYAAGDLGTFQMGATQSSFDHVNAWRYRFGYNVNLAESVSLAVTNEQIGAGFGDLSDYRSGAVGAPTMRNTLAAGVPLRGWGTLTGSYTGTRESGVAVEQRFGLEHSMLVAPSVRLAVGADRDVVTGDYEMRAGITMPVDAFMRGRWVPW
ncbi:fimbrial protein [Bordetella muralis]|uniref:fimbrial protein n=1 Tax=Bordetella muralis TaxID=1649130 RepID=UPI0039F05064